MEKETLKNKINKKIDLISLKPIYLSKNNNIYINYKSFKNDIYNYKYTKNIVKNHVKKNKESEIEKQKIYNYFVGGVINLCTNLLSGDYNNIFLKYNKIIGSRKNNHLRILFENINNSNYRNILLYIFFYIIPKTRLLIEKVKLNSLKNNSDSNISRLYNFYYNKDCDSNHTHSFNMERFINYDRLDIILYRIKDISINIPYNNNNSNRDFKQNKFFSEKIHKSTYKKKYDIHCLDNEYDINNVIFKKYTILLDIPLKFFNKDIKLQDLYKTLQNSSNLQIKFYTYNNEIKRMVYGIKKTYYRRSTEFYPISQSGFFNLIGNNSFIYKQNKETILNILIYCLRLLKESNIIEKKIEIIVVFYYLFIYLMPFISGTSSISEIALYTLWNTYINIDGRRPLNINKNTMIDVEALSLTYTQFYYNCFNKETEDDIYTPYFLNDIGVQKIEKKLHIKLLEKKIKKLKRNISDYTINIENNNSLYNKEELYRKLRKYEKILNKIKNLKNKIRNFTINIENNNSLFDKQELYRELRKLESSLHKHLLNNK